MFCKQYNELWDKLMQVYLNGNYINSKDAKISVLDRGFRFGDGVFETIRIANSSPYQLNLHLERLKNSMLATKINFAALPNIKEIISKLIKINKIVNGGARITISRGEGSIGYLPVDNITPTILIETNFGHHNIPKEASLWHSKIIKNSAQSLPVQAKTAQAMNSILARMDANENNCFEALLLNHEGFISEGSSSNIFWIKDEEVYTPSISCDLLPGIMRHSVISICPYKLNQGSYKIENILNADEVFLTNTSWLILPVIEFMPYEKKWKVGKITAQIKDLILKDIDKNG